MPDSLSFHFEVWQMRIFREKIFSSLVSFFFRLQGRVSVRVAVAAEILLGQGH